MPSFIHSIIFDLGGVLIDWDREYLYRHLIPDAFERRHFLEEVCPLSWNLELDRGLSFEVGIAERILRHPRHRELIRAYFDRWDEMIEGEIPGTVRILERLAVAGWPLYALTNFSRETFPRMPRRFPFLRHFRGILVSGEEGVVKPDPDIYRRMEQRFRLEPAGILFIDDNPDNVGAAKNLGWQALTFRNPEQLDADLQSLGLFFE